MHAMIIQKGLQARRLLLTRLHDFYHQKKIVVTGGAGFIGSHLTEQLVALGAHVTVVDNLSTGNLANLDAVKSQITFIEGSVTDYNTCLFALKNQEMVFHLAAVVSVPGSLSLPTACYEVNVNGTLNLLELARKESLKAFIYSSTAAVYGNAPIPCRETQEPRPISMYGLSKLNAEELCRYYARAYKIPTICLRYFNAFGPRQSTQGPYAAVIARFIDAMTNNKPITFYGDGTQTRDFIPIDQVVEANLILGMLSLHCLHGQPINIGLGQQRSLLDLYSTLRGLFPGYILPLRYLPARPSDIMHSRADITHYCKLLDFMAGQFQDDPINPFYVPQDKNQKMLYT